MHLDFLNMYLHLRDAESRRNHAKYSEKSKTAKHTIKEGKSEEKRRFIKQGKSEEKRFSSFLITATNMIGGEENFQT